MKQIRLATLPQQLYIYRLPGSTQLVDLLARIQASGETPELFATLHSDDELSIVSPADPGTSLGKMASKCSGPWRAMRVAGELDFALTGILSALAAPLAAAQISIFATSSFDTDYLLVNADALSQAIVVLEDAGYPVDKGA